MLRSITGAPALLSLFLILAPAVWSQTVTVTTSANVIDIDFFTGTVQDLPGPDGVVSFLEAIVATNHTPGHQTIAFNIPQNEWVLQFLYPGCAVLVAGANGFNCTDSVTIDGTTQTAFTGDTNPTGNEVAIYLPFGTLGAGIGGDGSSLLGFHAGEWSVGGDNSQVVGNTGAMHINYFGDFGLIEGNEAGTIKIDGGSHNVVVGNSMQRVRIWGGVANRVGGPDLADRNFITGYGTTNSEGLPAGTDVELWQTQDTVIENNFIGTTPDGLSQGNQFQTMGIEVDTGNVGLRVRDNLIAGVLGHGQGPHWAGTLWGWAVYFQGSGSDVEFSGNTIGLDAAGNPNLPSVWGVHTGSSTYVDVRFLDNVIAGHYLNGVTVGGSTSSVRLAGNAIHDNAWSGTGFLGIDLLGASQATGVTPNDPLDADTGGNGLQNYPELDAIVRAGNDLRITGSLHSSPDDDFTLEFFASPQADETGFGQGQLPLGTATVTTDAFGDAAFDVSLATPVPDGWFVCSTATLEPLGATSEFSACLQTSSVWTDAGGGTPGIAGIPQLTGEGSLVGGTPVSLTLSGAPDNGLLLLWIATTSSPLDIFGGTLHAFPFTEQLLLGADGTGGFFGQTTWPTGLPTGTDVWFQFLVQDPSVVFGITLSNAAQGTTP